MEPSKKYWDRYYTVKRERTPSRFAKFCKKYMKQKPGYLLDIGCGNGRDSYYFATDKDIFVVALDRSSNVDPKDINNLVFIKDDFSNIYKLKKSGFIPNYVYSRFSLHSISKKKQNKIIKEVYNILQKEGLFFIEVRSIKDEKYGKGKQIEKDAYFSDHYRRFIRKQELELILTKNRFKIIYSKEAKNYALYKNENPKVIRIIAQK